MGLPVTSPTATVVGGYEAVAPSKNFSTVSLTADEAVLSNRLSPLDQEERVTIRARAIPRVDSSLQIRNPAPVTAGVAYEVMLEETLRTTVGDKVVDEPIVIRFLARHPRSANITDAVLKQCLRRLLGVLLLPAHSAEDTVLNMLTGNSTTRLLDFSRFSELPTYDSAGANSQDTTA